MVELIPIKRENGKQVVSARDLYNFLGCTERFQSWFDRQLQYGFIENQDFTSVKSFTLVNNGAEREIDDFAMTLNMAKEVSMIQRNDKGKQARQYFIECEKIARNMANENRRGLTVDFRGYTVEDKMVVIEYASRILNLNDVSKLAMVKSVADPMGIPTPDYTPSKGVLKSATDLLKENNVQMSAIAFNKIAVNKGVLIEMSRKSSHGVKKFKNISNSWLDYGENQVNPNNPRETQPLWYVNKFPELLKKMDIV